MKLLQEMRGFAYVTNRRPQPRTPGLFLLQMRSHMLHASQPTEKRTINVYTQAPPDLPHPIKIKHLGGGSAPQATRPSP
jgi:hypothetical protein